MARHHALTVGGPPPSGGGFVELPGWLQPAGGSGTGLQAAGVDRAGLVTYTGSSTPAAGTHLIGQRCNGLDLSNASAVSPIVLERCLINVGIPAGFADGMIATLAPNEHVYLIDSDLDAAVSGVSQATRAFQTAVKSSSGVWHVERCWITKTGRGIFSAGGAVECQDTVMDGFVGTGDPGGSGSHNECVSQRGSGQVNYRRSRFDISGAADNASAAFQIIAADSTTGFASVEGSYFSDGPEYAFTAEVNPGTLATDSIDVIDCRWHPSVSPFNVVNAAAIDQWTDNYRYAVGSPPLYRGAAIGSPS